MNVKKDLIYVSKFASTQMSPMTVSATMDTHLMVMDYHAVVSSNNLCMNTFVINCLYAPAVVLDIIIVCVINFHKRVSIMI